MSLSLVYTFSFLIEKDYWRNVKFDRFEALWFQEKYLFDKKYSLISKNVETMRLESSWIYIQ